MKTRKKTMKRMIEPRGPLLFSMAFLLTASNCCLAQGLKPSPPPDKAPVIAPVPMAMPHANKYQPSHSAGVDFHDGDQTHGWVCLGADVTITKPIHCQYNYRAGSGYVAPLVGGVDPGPTGFEISAQGDVDSDAVISTFAIAGVIDPVTGKLTLTPLFAHNPLE